MAGPPPDSWAVDPSQAGVRKVADGLWRLRLPWAWGDGGHVNAYVIAHEDGIVLVDCGTAGHPTCVIALETALARAGFAPEDVRTLVITHAHSDHAGLAPWVVERSDCEVWMHPDTGHFFDAVREPDRVAAARERRAAQECVPADRLEDCADVREELQGALGVVTPDRPLVEGVVVPSDLGGWTVLETPGHCPSHVILVQFESRIAILGDVVCSAFTPWLDYGYSADPAGEHVGAVRRVAALGPGVTGLPGHGRPIDDLPGVAALYEEGLRVRIATTFRVVAEGPGSGYAISRRVFGRPRNRTREFSELTETLCYLRHLRLAGAIVREESPGGTFLYRRGPAGPEGSAQLTTL